jgi:transposase-like protein
VAAPKKYPDELRERAVRLYRESDPKPVIHRLAEQLNVHVCQEHERELDVGMVSGRDALRKMKDNGPSESPCVGETSNRHMLRRLRPFVVSDVLKGAS